MSTQLEMADGGETGPPSWRIDPDATRGRFEGAAHGSPVSAFIVDAAPGQGPELHTHPYTETFVVQQGRGRFRRGEDEVIAAAGDLVVVPPDTIHRFEAVGPEHLRLVAIHAAAVMETVWIEPQRAD